jgi:hypothetical protein
MHQRKLTLEKAIDQLISQLETAGIIKTTDKEDLKRQVLENLEPHLDKDNVPKEVLRDPRFILKLTMCIVATNTLQAGRPKAFAQQLFSKDPNELQLKTLMKQLMEMTHNPKNLQLLLQLLMKDAKEKQQEEKQAANLEKDPNSPDNKFICIVEGGVVIDIVEGVFGNNPLTIEEMAAMGDTEELKEFKAVLTFGQDILNEMNAVESPRPSPYK